jgi:hypothetical protein
MKLIRFGIQDGGIKISRNSVNFYENIWSHFLTLYMNTTSMTTLGVFKLRLRNYLRDALGVRGIR